MLRRTTSVGAAGYRWRGGEQAGACTESLGSDSGDVGCDAAEIAQFFPPVPAAAGGGGPDAADDADAAPLCGVEEAAASEATEKRHRRRGGGFPPAMPRATGALFLHSERVGGRLILTEVRADEHERRVVFRAERDGGRLRLRFAKDDDDDTAAAEDGGGEPEEDVGGGSAGAGTGGVVPVAVQHGGGGGGGGGELCQVAAGAAAGLMGVEVGAVMMGTTI